MTETTYPRGHQRTEDERALLTYGPDGVALLATLRAGLDPAQQALLARLLGAVDNHICAQLRDDEAARWGALLAHIPGYAPTLHVLRAHVEEGEVDYCPGGAACRVIWPCPA